VRDPYRLLLWEQVAYLASDAERLAAYRLLETSVGTDPAEILAAPAATLRAVARRGGSIGVAQRADRLRTVARRVFNQWEGKLQRVLKQPFKDARRELTRYPSIGEAGAERILLLSGAFPVLGLDSNALRVLLRLGYGREHAQWQRTYRAAQSAAEAELPETITARRSAYLLLRYHGQTLCRRSAPRCVECPLRRECPVGRGSVVGGRRRP
jgi:endonuclease III